MKALWHGFTKWIPHVQTEDRMSSISEVIKGFCACFGDLEAYLVPRALHEVWY